MLFLAVFPGIYPRRNIPIRIQQESGPILTKICAEYLKGELEEVNVKCKIVNTWALYYEVFCIWKYLR